METLNSFPKNALPQKRGALVGLEGDGMGQRANGGLSALLRRLTAQGKRNKGPMKIVFQFALGGFGIVIGVCLAGIGVSGALEGFGPLDFLWLFYGVAAGLVAAVAGAALAGVGLLLQRIFPRPASRKPPTADDDTVWPPPPGPAAGR